MSSGSHRLPLGFFVCVLAALLSGCGGSSVSYPAPSISKLTPDHATAGDPTFVLTIAGGNLTPASTVSFNGTALALFQFTSTSSISVRVPAALVQNPGQVPVSVFTPTPGGGTSQTLTFTIFAGPSPVPQVSSLVPSGVSTGAGSFTLTVKGTNFVAQSSVNVNGSARTTRFVDTATLEAAIPSSDAANAGILQVSVVNPSPGGGASNSVPLTVTNPVPLLASLSPVAILAGGTGSQLTIAGSSFVPNSVVMVNGSPRTTTFGGSTALTVAVTAADLAVAGLNQVEVLNPPPGGGTSNALPFAVDPTLTTGLPVLVDLAPDGSQANNAICGAAPCPPGAIPTLATAGPSASQTGQLVAYASISTNLVLLPSSHGLSEIFVRDTCLSTTGATGGSSSCVPRNTLVSQAQTGAAADAPSAEPSLDTAGAHVAYTSTASNLVTSPSVPAGGPRQVYVQPTCVTPGSTTGCSVGSNSGAALVSISPDGSNSGNADSYTPQISPDGQFVAFASQATNLLSPAITPANPQIYLYGACSAQSTSTGVTVSLSGKANATTTLGASGTYSFSGLANGNYTVTPSGEGFSFSPANQSVTVNGANVTSINFTGTSIPTIYSISGTITPASDGAGAAVTLSGAGSATTTVGPLGDFTFTNISNGNYTVVPSKAGFSFSPSNLPATVNGGDVTGLSFTASTTAFNISGTVSPATGGAGAFLVLSAGTTQIGTTTADSSGNYTFTGLANGAYTVTASNSGFTFSPDSRPVTISGANVTGVNFTATALTTNSFSISGTVTAPPPPTCTQNVHLVSTPDGTTAANGPSSQPSVSSGGTFVAFASSAPNLLAVVNGAANPQTTPQQVYVQNTCITGAFGCAKTVTLVSTPDSKTPATPANGSSSEPSISSDGRFIAFASTATNLGAASGGIQQIYVRDTCAGVTGSTACTPTTFLVSTVNGTTPANALAENPSVNKRCTSTTTVNAALCATGQFVAFASRASNLGPATQQGVENVFSRNTCSGLASTATCTPNTFLASQPAGTSPPAANGDSIVPSVSGDGLTVSFISSASNLVTRDSNGLADVFLAGAVRSFLLTLTLKGATTNTSGSVSDNLSEISCRLASGTQTGMCSAPYLTGTSVTLTATATSGSVFKGWSGGVTATQCPATTTTCTVTMTGDLAVTASFQ